MTLDWFTVEVKNISIFLAYTYGFASEDIDSSTGVVSQSLCEVFPSVNQSLTEMEYFPKNLYLCLSEERQWEQMMRELSFLAGVSLQNLDLCNTFDSEFIYKL